MIRFGILFVMHVIKRVLGITSLNGIQFSIFNIMKRIHLNFKQGVSAIHIPRPALVLVAVLLAIGLSVTPDVNAQRHGGGSVRGMRAGGGSRIGQSLIHTNNSRAFSGNFVHRNHFGSHFYGYRGFPGWRFSFFPFWGDYYWGLPPFALRFYLDGYNYYDSDGVYFKQDEDKYEVVPAPIGHKVKVLPKGSMQFTLDGAQYYYYYGTYYIPAGGQYEVVQPPIGAEVDSIPNGYDKVMVDGQTYFTLNGVQYKAVLRDNVIWYRVVKNNGNNPEPSKPQTNQEPM